MEASVAADAGQPDAAPEGQQPGLDLTPITEQITGMGANIQQLQTMLEQRLGSEEEPAAEDEFDYSDLFGEPDAETGERGAFDPQAVQQMIQQEAQKLIEAQTAPLRDQVRQIQVGLDAEQLVAKYPDLNDDAVVGPVVQAAQALAEAVGDPSLAQNPQVVELIYKAQRADKQAAGERPVGAEQGFDLERAGGAGPAAVEPNIAERVIADAKAHKFWEHW